MAGTVLRRIARAATVLLLGGFGIVASALPAHAASLTKVSSFGSNPGALNMYSYRPDGLPSGAPLVVALHGCTQSASDYFTNAGWQKYADLWKFALVFAEQTSSNNSSKCFNWFQTGDTTRGQGEALSIKQMVDYAISNYGSDPKRVYVTGLSAGGAMTAVMLATYPDVFTGGSVVAGVPYRCATDLSSATNCQYNAQNKTPQQWGDLVRNAYPGYSGPWPRVAIWYGTSDTTVVPANATELRDQWTNVWGISQTASSTQSLPGSTTLSNYNDSTGRTAVQLYSIQGIAHGQPVDPGTADSQCGTTGTYYLKSICAAYYSAKFWGLDGSSGGGGGGSLPAPTGLTVTGTTTSSVSLSWNAVSGASGYYVYRDGSRITSSAVSGTGYTDSGLASGTTYSYAVSAVDSSGVEGARSGTVSATTGGTAYQCYTDNNYNQVLYGRAHQSMGYVYANGSNDYMGLYNVYETHTLKQTGTNYYVLADGQC
ncbi:MAG TPA: PHB depolymerase family esterase [Micromonosporaceae bacterium]